MNDQRATKDQLDDLAVLVADHELPEEAAWIRLGGGYPAPSDVNRRICVKIANAHGLYDAADWIRTWDPADE